MITWRESHYVRVLCIYIFYIYFNGLRIVSESPLTR
jgi:hypothetical protein